MRTLIDTNAYSALMKGNEAVACFLDMAETVYLSVVVAGELLTGFRGGQQEKRNRSVLGDFIKRGGKTVVLPVSLATAERFALIKSSLKKRGTPIPLNDIWIAAQCLETGAVLLSLDSHFWHVDGLLLWEQQQDLS
jgi:tRNA(fMet)-specific endonuclease VapC